MSAALTLFIFLTAMGNDTFQDWFQKNVKNIAVGFILFGIIDWFIIISYFKSFIL